MSKKSLNFKIIAVVAILIAGSSIISFIGLNKLGDLNTVMTDIVDRQVVHAFVVRDIKDAFFGQAIDQRNIILEPSADEMTAIQSKMNARENEISTLMDTYEAETSDTGKAEIIEFRKKYLEWWDVTQKISALSLKNDKTAAFDLSKKQAAPLRNEAAALLKKITDRQQENMHHDSLHADTQYKDARLSIVVISALAILLGVSLATVVLISLSKAISQIIEALNGGSGQVSAASEQIASSSGQLSSASSEQAASLEETVATLEELTAMVQVNTKNAKEAAALSETTRNIATQGETEIRSLVTSMGYISADSKRIEEIITVIDDIAFQTNLLALNAAVEAARAGEQGKGFAVVAEAVRNLAQRSAIAAKDISALIKGSVEKIERGNTQAEKSGQVLEKVLIAVKKVSDLNAEIATASEGQSNGLAQISQAMNQLDQVTQINAASSEETAASAQELSTQALKLNKVVDLLTTTIRGHNNEINQHAA